jgi:hypothetical protein
MTPLEFCQITHELRDMVADWEALARGPQAYFRHKGYQRVQVNSRWFWLPPDADAECAKAEIVRRWQDLR